MNVITPFGSQIYIGNPIDNETGGKFEGDRNAAVTGTAWRTQNIYFPPGAPPGTYLFFVETIHQRGIADIWNVTAWNNGEIEKSSEASGFSGQLSLNIFECTKDEQCTDKMCFYNHCIPDTQSKLRFTLTWAGSDEIDISIQTPLGKQISWEDPYDEVSGGELFDPYLYQGRRLKYVTFDLDGDALAGNYTIEVENYSQSDGEKANPWNLTVFVDGNQTDTWQMRSGVKSTIVWEYVKPSPPTFFCFSGMNQVKLLLENGSFQTKNMKDLQIGDFVQSSTSGEFSRVYSLGHVNHDTWITYYQITTSSNAKLELTSDHMLWISGKQMTPASLVQVGDTVQTTLAAAKVTKIATVVRKGAYAPLTEDGTIVVTDILASCYPTLLPNQSRLFFDLVSMHTISHLGLVLRRQFGSTEHETYTADGIATWAYDFLVFGLWFVRQDVQMMIMMLAVTVVCVIVATAFLLFLRQRRTNAYDIKIKTM